MNKFKDFLKIIEKEDKGEQFQMVHGLSGRILPALAELGGGNEAVRLFCTFLFTTMAADGRLAEAEFLTAAPLFHAFFGEDFDYDICREYVMDAKNEDVTTAVITLLHRLPAELQGDMILVAFILCAVDGKVSRKEKAYLKKLLS